MIGKVCFLIALLAIPANASEWVKCSCYKEGNVRFEACIYIFGPKGDCPPIDVRHEPTPDGTLEDDDTDEETAINLRRQALTRYARAGEIPQDSSGPVVDEDDVSLLLQNHHLEL